MSPVEELWLVFRTATGNRVSVWTQESFQNRFQKFFKSRLRMIVRVIVVPLLTMTDVSTTCAVVDIIRFIFRIYLKKHCPYYFFNIPARMSVSLPFVWNQKSHLIGVHACNHCLAGSRAQTCWARGPVQIQDKTITQPSPQAFSARSFLDSTISCDVTENSRGQRIKRERLGTRLALIQALAKNW